MILDKKAAFALAVPIAQKHAFDPLLILAMIEQESAYNTEAVRLENGFFAKYMKPLDKVATTTKVLRSTSFGLMQLMGDSLYEIGLFAADPSPAGVVRRIDEYMLNFAEQVDTGGAWLRRKMDFASARTVDISEGLRRYNGSSEYPPQVMTRMQRLQGEHFRGVF